MTTGLERSSVLGGRVPQASLAPAFSSKARIVVCRSADIRRGSLFGLGSQARRGAVIFHALRALGFAPRASNKRTILAWPRLQARCKAVALLEKIKLTLYSSQLPDP